LFAFELVLGIFDNDVTSAPSRSFLCHDAARVSAFTCPLLFSSFPCDSSPSMQFLADVFPIQSSSPQTLTRLPLFPPFSKGLVVFLVRTHISLGHGRPDKRHVCISPFPISTIPHPLHFSLDLILTVPARCFPAFRKVPVGNSGCQYKSLLNHPHASFLFSPVLDHTNPHSLRSRRRPVAGVLSLYHLPPFSAPNPPHAWPLYLPLSTKSPPHTSRPPLKDSTAHLYSVHLEGPIPYSTGVFPLCDLALPVDWSPPRAS